MKRFLAGVMLSILVLAPLAALPAAASDTKPAAEVLHCTNPISGATWDLPLDLAKRKVASFPARINARSITWRDPVHNGRFHLDRRTGRLTIVYPSSTGGFFLTDNCRLEASP